MPNKFDPQYGLFWFGACPIALCLWPLSGELNALELLRLGSVGHTCGLPNIPFLSTFKLSKCGVVWPTLLNTGPESCDDPERCKITDSHS